MMLRVVVAAAGLLAAGSVHALMWDEADLPSANLTIEDVSAGPGGFLAAAVDRSMIFLSSSDGATWTEVSRIDHGPEHGRLAGGAGVYVFVTSWGTHACSQPRCIWVSPTGAAWNLLDFESDVRGVSEIVFGNDRFVALGGPAAIEGPQLNALVSSDGYKWQAGMPLQPGTSYVAGLSFAGGTFFAGAYSASGPEGFYRSVDGVEWEYHAAPCYFAGGVAFGNGQYLTQTNSGDACVSVDGIQWTVVPIERGIFGSDGITYVEGRFYSGGIGHTTSSVDGSDWREELPAGGLLPRQSFAVAGTNVAAFGRNGIWRGDIDRLFASGFGYLWVGD